MVFVNEIAAAFSDVKNIFCILEEALRESSWDPSGGEILMKIPLLQYKRKIFKAQKTPVK